MILGSVLASIGLEIFLIPNNIIDGGITGISIMANHLTNISLGIFILVLNITFLIVGYKQIGKTFAISTLFSVVCLSIGVSILEPVSGITQDTLLAAIFGGIILGAGVGLIIKNGGSLDGTEIITIILDKKSSFSVGEIVMFFNLFILGSSGLLFGWVTIVSDKHPEISKALTDRMGRGVTLLHGEGAYQGSKTNVIYVVISRLEIAKLKGIVHGFDEDALLTIANVEASGKRYGKKTIH